MRILVIGGTRFVGRHAVLAARDHGHTVTLFHRGRTSPDLFPGAERILGDRETDLARLAGRRWDAVLDTCGYLPAPVRAATAALRGATARYLYVSSISAYADATREGLTEDDALAAMPPGAPEAVTAETYGPLKARCEAEVRAAFGADALIVRPGLVLGPHDPTDRSGYWPRRMTRGGEVLAPGRPERPIQYVDARDLAAWMVDLLERGMTGTFHAAGPEPAPTMADWLEASRAAAGTAPRVTWVGEGFLLARGVVPFFELPLWVEEREKMFGTLNTARARGAGLRFRPPGETLRDVLAWQRTLPNFPHGPEGTAAMPAGLAADRETELLAAWHARA